MPENNKLDGFSILKSSVWLEKMSTFQYVKNNILCQEKWNYLFYSEKSLCSPRVFNSYLKDPYSDLETNKMMLWPTSFVHCSMYKL